MTSISSKQIGLTKKAFAFLSQDAQDALNYWESGRLVDLEEHVRKNDKVAQEIESVFSIIRKQFPRNVKLYRGILNKSVWTERDRSTRILESWSSDKKEAELFANRRRIHYDNKRISAMKNEYTAKEIMDAVNNYKRRGFATFGNRKFMRNKEMPEYCNMYDKKGDMITDLYHKDFEKYIIEMATDNETSNMERASEGTILEEMIDTSRIIWITNKLNSKEYIVRKK